MKRFLHFFIILLFTGCIATHRPSGHHIPITSVITSQTEAFSSTAYPSFLSNYARLFIHTLNQEIPLCSIPEKYIPSADIMKQFPTGILKDSIFCISGFLEVESGFKLKQLKELGIFFTQSDELFSSAMIPLHSLCKFLQLKGIIRFELTRKAEFHLDVARPAVNAQLLLRPIAQNRAYTGKGIIMGIVDYGFDYTHPDFYDSTGSIYRISRVWEQINPGTPPDIYSYGNELIQKDAILNAGTDTKTETHGTHVAGIAAGSGAGTQYYGLAPDAEIVLVSTNRTDTGIADGLRYIADYARQQNKPCVINFSLGSSIGPHDGTSSFDRLCDHMIQPGLLFTGSVGNDGNLPIYLEADFPKANNSDTVSLSGMIPNKSTNQMIADIWGQPGKDFSAAVILIDTLSGKHIGSTTSISSTTGKVFSFNLGRDSTLVVIQIAGEINKYNQKPTIMVQVNITSNLPQSYIPVLKISSGQVCSISTWLSYGTFSNLNQASPFQKGSTTNTVSEIGGTGKSIISAGAFCTKKDWISTDMKAYSYGPAAILGEVAYFSSSGPTADGRIKPDISCPGYGVVSAFSHFFNGTYPPAYYRVKQVQFPNQNYFMGILQGTSEAAPIVAGTIALWLQEKPDLTFEEARQIIRDTAIPASSSPLPDNRWGWGILNAGRGMDKLKL
ncbi:MAG: S8 family serine peptidase [Bacteroidales bacterium]